MQAGRQRPREGAGDQGGLAAAADPGDHGEGAEGQAERDIPQVVAGGPGHHQSQPGSPPPGRGGPQLQVAEEAAGGEPRALEEGGRGPLRDEPPALDP
ncbi:MAG: hypothetical protein ACK559_10150, partial [bacterium]